MDTFMCSSWYFLRYASPHYVDGSFEPQKVEYWLPVDQYTGGAEHATMHLLYARFFIKALHDIGLVDFTEPFTRLFNQGIIICQRQKMSKSRGNVITPDEYVSELGADAVRAYLMFVGPWEQGGEWNDNGLNGVVRWLNRVWDLSLGGYDSEAHRDQAAGGLRRLTHKTIKRVTEDLERFHYNTMLAALMEFTNYLARVREEKSATRDEWQEAIKALLLLLAPTTPHVAEELWTRTGQPYSIHNQLWPSWNEDMVRQEQFTLVIQVNGKLRDRAAVPTTITQAEAEGLALGKEKVKAHLRDRSILRVVYIPGRLVNIVTG